MFNRALNMPPRGVIFAPDGENSPSRSPNGPNFDGLGQNWIQRSQTEPSALGVAWEREGETVPRNRARSIGWTRRVSNSVASSSSPRLGFPAPAGGSGESMPSSPIDHRAVQ